MKIDIPYFRIQELEMLAKNEDEDFLKREAASIRSGLQSGMSIWR